MIMYTNFIHVRLERLMIRAHAYDIPEHSTYLVPTQVVDNARQQCIPSDADCNVRDGLREPREQSFWNKGAGVTKTSGELPNSVTQEAAGCVAS
jgi:hypothetical protein